MPTRPSSRGTNGSLRRVSVLESCRFTVRILPAGSEVGGDREADGDGEDALAPAGEAEALGRLGGDPRRCRLHGEHAGQVGAHLADVVAEARLVAEDGDGQVHGGPAAGRDHLGDLPAEVHAGGALEGGVVLREVRPEVVEAGRAEQRVAGGVGDHVSVGVAVQATIERDGHPTEDQRATFDQRMDVDALPDPHRLGDHGGLLVRVSSASATSRSRAVVTFRFSWLPGTTWTGWPANSTSAASSEASTPSSMALRCAASRASRTKSCGVWTARSWSRSTIPRERWSSSTRRTVSTTGTPGTTPAGRRGSGDPPEGSGESRRGAPVGRGVPRWDGSPAPAPERAASSSSSRRSTEPRPGSGRAASCTATKAGPGGMAARPPATTATTLAKPSSASSLALAPSASGCATTTTAVTQSLASIASTAWTSSGRPASRTSALGPWLRRRRPMPAAATTTPTDGGAVGGWAGRSTTRAPRPASGWPSPRRSGLRAPARRRGSGGSAAACASRRRTGPSRGRGR